MVFDLKSFYNKEVVGKLIKEFNYKSSMQVPRILKVVVNRGVGEALVNAKALEVSIEELTAITGQKPMLCKAKKSIATFKLREKQIIGLKVTLRQERMYDFLTKFINFCLPRVRDFRGVPSKFDGRGNYTFGVKEQIIFPEISYEKVDKIRGMDITVVTSAKTDKEAKALLKLIGVPFRN